MIEMTPAARERLDGYLQRLRISVRGTSLQPDDLEQSVREHVDIALDGAPQPVAVDYLATVLERLGPPEGWVADEERPFYRRIIDRIQFGPDDWRLAYFAFGAFLVAIITFPFAGPLFLIPSYLLSRAAVDLFRQRGEEMGARKWLILPSIAIALMFIAALTLIAPVAAIAAWGVEERNFFWVTRSQQPHVMVGAVGLAAGAWWITAAALFAIFLKPLRFIVAPLLDRVERKHMFGLAIVGAIVAGLGAALVWA